MREKRREKGGGRRGGKEREMTGVRLVNGRGCVNALRCCVRERRGSSSLLFISSSTLDLSYD